MPSSHYSYSLWIKAVEAALIKLPQHDTTTAICWQHHTFWFLLFEQMQRSEVASLYCSGIAATRATNDLLWHQSLPSLHWLIIFLTPCRHAVDLLSHASFLQSNAV